MVNMPKHDPSCSRSSCPIGTALDVIGDRWTLLVVRDLGLAGKSRFSEIGQPEGIATNILAERLARLEKVGVVIKERDPDDGRKRSYRLTEKGKDLLPIVMEMAAWGLKHTDDGESYRAMIEAYSSDRDGALQAIRSRLD